MYRLFFIVLSLLALHAANGQTKDTTFRNPLDIPPFLSGTFAELRANHLHSGIDFRTQGVPGHKVYASERGYVSRIKVEPGGYGNALYITHPNGYSTVYGHLQEFNEEITAYVKEQQYQKERFEVDLYPDSTRFRIKRGQMVGLSGNSGSSGGPHLHFEVRDAKTEEPINPLLFGFGIKDNIPPIIRQLAVYPLGEGSTVNGSAEKLILNVEKVGKKYRIAGNTKLTVKGNVAFGIDTYDQSYGSVNRCGIYQIMFSVDSQTLFSQRMDKFSFDDTRYVNSLIDYSYYVEKRIRFNRLYVESNNQLTVYNHSGNGIISFPDSSNHTAQITVRDIHGNSSILDFSFTYLPIDRDMLADFWTKTDIAQAYTTHHYDREFIFSQPDIQTKIPANALYENINFEYNVDKTPRKGIYSPIYSIHNVNTPIHRAISVEILADSVPENNLDKALLIRIENGKHFNAGGTHKDGVIVATLREFGSYAIALDTIAPRIVPINIKNNANITGAKNIRFKITDDLSGIRTYNGWIDGSWILFEYDAKNNLISYEFDPKRVDKNKKHMLRVQVADAKNNIAVYEADFVW